MKIKLILGGYSIIRVAAKLFLVKIRNLIKFSTIMLTRFFKKRNDINLNKDMRVEMMTLGESDKHYFFGYHDISPFSCDDNYVLACRSAANAHSLAEQEELEIGFFDLSCASPVFEKVASTKAWCWQQGCRLQWYPYGSNTAVLFNDTLHNKHVCRIVNIAENTEIATLPYPIYSVNNSGRHGVSLDFVRLQRLRPGYGYSGLPEQNRGESAPRDNGLYLVDMWSGIGELVFSLAEAGLVRSDETMVGAEHYFNHVLWSPCGTQFFFMHLWRRTCGKRFNRAFVYDLSTSQVKLLNKGNPVSHHCWISETNLIVFSEGSYREIDINGRVINIVGEGILTEDGHPSMSPNSTELFVTDTYPDKLGEQKLFVFDRTRNKLLEVCSFYTPSKYKGEVRCDLHPRWDHSGQRICVDTAHAGERRLCILKMNGSFADSSGRLD